MVIFKSFYFHCRMQHLLVAMILSVGFCGHKSYAVGEDSQSEPSLKKKIHFSTTSTNAENREKLKKNFSSVESLSLHGSSLMSAKSDQAAIIAEAIKTLPRLQSVILDISDIGRTMESATRSISRVINTRDEASLQRNLIPVIVKARQDLSVTLGLFLEILTNSNKYLHVTLVLDGHFDDLISLLSNSILGSSPNITGFNIIKLTLLEPVTAIQKKLEFSTACINSENKEIVKEYFSSLESLESLTLHDNNLIVSEKDQAETIAEAIKMLPHLQNLTLNLGDIIGKKMTNSESHDAKGTKTFLNTITDESNQRLSEILKVFLELLKDSNKHLDVMLVLNDDRYDNISELAKNILTSPHIKTLTLRPLSYYQLLCVIERILITNPVS